MIFNIYETSEGRNYLITTLEEVESLILKCFSLSSVKDYNIEKAYYKLDWTKGIEPTNVIITEEEFIINNQLGDSCYRQTLNYDDLLEDYCLDVYLDFVRCSHFNDSKKDFLNMVMGNIVEADTDIKSKNFYRAVLNDLFSLKRYLQQDLDTEVLNEIQSLVSGSILSDYDDTIRRIFYEFENIYPSISSEFIDKINQLAQNLNNQQLDSSQEINGQDMLALNKHIFKDNAFKVWEYLKEKLRLENTSRSDVKFIYEEMKKDGLIHKTVNQTFFLDWVNQTYDMEIQKTSNHHRTPFRLERYQEALDLYNSGMDT